MTKLNVEQLRNKKIGIAVSGGLDSCTITRWLADREVEVICFTAELGQPDEDQIGDVKARMLASGATEMTVISAKEALASAGLKMIQSQAKYEGGYWNTTGVARHITVEAILPEMRKRGIKIFAHGSTGRGNDQVRFQLATNMLAPDFEIYAPWRDKIFLDQFGGRSEMIDFCQQKNLPITATRRKPYSTDANFLGLTHEAGKLESLETPASFVVPKMGVSPQNAPDADRLFTVTFNRGVPIELDGKPVNPIEAIENANSIGGKHGIGIGVHVVENRFVGVKSRGIYEAPGMELLGKCYEYLLQLVLDRRARKIFDKTSAELAEQVYQGYWFDRATQSLIASIEPFTALATGTITVSLYKGNISFHSANSMPHSLYSEETASMEALGNFDHSDSEGFLAVLGISAKALAISDQVIT